MQKILFFVSLLFVANLAKSQVNQITVGASNVTVLFKSVKYDPSDGGTINVGYKDDPSTGTGRDCYMVKLSASQQIVWQKSIPNVGADSLQQVIVCANGDYLAVGQVTVSGIIRGFACRLNRTNGDVIWASNSSNSSGGEVFWDVVETANGNIAIAGIEFSSSTNTFIVLLNSMGNTLWSKVSSFGNNDGAFAINQLPNGNLIIGAQKWVGYYNAVIIELNELTGTIISQTSYTINTPAPNSSLTLNSLFPWSIKIKNGTVLFYIKPFEGCCSFFSMSLYVYDQASKQLSGNIYYHTGDVNAIEYTYVPLSSTDFLIAQSYRLPARVYVSRVINGTVVYDRLLNSSAVSIYSMDTTATNSIYAGQANYNTYNNSFNLISPRSVPATTASCSITNSNTLALQASTLTGTVTSALNLSPSSALFASSLTTQTAAYSLNTICGASVLPITLLSFNAYHNSSSNTTKLQWSTTNEINSKSFIIERSTDNSITFIPLGSLNAHGFTTSLTEYTFIDNNPLKGTNFYRLKEIDVDNKFKYSKIVSIESGMNKINKYYLSPNPANNFTLINSALYTSEKVNIYVFDVSGRLIKKESGKIDSNHPYKLFLTSSHGLYHIKVQSTAASETLKLIVK